MLSPHTSGTTAPRAVLPLWWKKQGKGATKHEPWGGSTAYKRYYRAPQRYYRWRSRTRDQKCSSGTTARPERYYRLQAVLLPIGAVLPLIGGTAVQLLQNSTRKMQDPKSRRYQRGTVAVLPLMAIGGTTACGDTRYCRSGPAVLPLAPALCQVYENKYTPRKTRTAITSANELRIEQTQACWIQDNE